MPTAKPSSPRSSILRRGRQLLRACALVALGVVGAQASAAVMYTYTGKPFENASGIFSTSDFMLFKFVLNTPVAASQTGVIVAPLSWELSVGAWSISSATSGVMILGASQLTTDAAGNIDAACFSGFTPVGAFNIQSGDTVGDLLPLTSCSIAAAGPREEVAAGTLGSLGQGSSDFNSGSWTMAAVVDPDPNPMPLPGSLAMAALALWAAGRTARRAATTA